MTDAPLKSFTSRKLDLMHRAMADGRMSAAQFRYFVRALKGCNQTTGVAALADQAFMDDVKECGSRDTAKAMRKQIAALGYFSFVPGSGRTKTEYRFNWASNKQVDVVVDANARRRAARRAAEDKAWREGDAGPRLNNTPDGVLGPRLNRPSRAKRDGVSGYRGDGVSGHRQTGFQDPPYTLQDTPSPQTPSYRATEESRYHQGAEDNLLIPKSVLALLGVGDVAEGRLLAEVVPQDRLAEILDFASKFGASACRDGIAEARDLALSILSRRASA